MAISILPVFLGSLLYYFHGYFQLKTLNHGVLINPPIQMKTLNTLGEKQWQIIYIPQQCCDAICQKTMFTLHQLKKVLGKESKRVNLVLASQQNCQIKELHDFKKLLFTARQYPQLRNDKIYLLDPLGNLFMYYSANTDPMNILSDLKRVLEVSQIG